MRPTEDRPPGRSRRPDRPREPNVETAPSDRRRIRLPGRTPSSRAASGFPDSLRRALLARSRPLRTNFAKRRLMLPKKISLASDRPASPHSAAPSHDRHTTPPRIVPEAAEPPHPGHPGRPGRSGPVSDPVPDSNPAAGIPRQPAPSAAVRTSEIRRRLAASAGPCARLPPRRPEAAFRPEDATHRANAGKIRTISFSKSLRRNP